MATSRRAMIIATGTHVTGGLPDLEGPTHDALAMTVTLRTFGCFTVEAVLIDRPAGELLNRITMFLESFGEEETALLYFSGHGFRQPAGGPLWLAGTNTDADRPGDTALSAEAVRRLLKACRARAKIWILDCCNAAAAGLAQTKGDGGFFAPLTRDDPLVANEDDRQPATAVTMVRVQKGTAYPAHQGRGLYFLFAAGDDQPAADGEGGSPYTNLLIKGMTSMEADRDGDGWVSAWELARYVDDAHRRMKPPFEIARMAPSSDVHGAAEGNVWMIRVQRAAGPEPAAPPTELTQPIEPNETRVEAPVTAPRTPLRRALGDPVGPVSGTAAGVMLGTLTWMTNHSWSTALAAGVPVGVGGYLVYLAAGIYLLRRPSAGTPR